MNWKPLNDYSFSFPTHVVLGNHNLKNGQIVEIKKKFVYSSYNTPEKGDDIMLLQVSTSLYWQQFHMKYICGLIYIFTFYCVCPVGNHKRSTR